ncbi:DUF1365 domain-containing protein [Nocardioides mesophilus]|uniref:DUF1365 domain-containing protein n=1 Tax=Nocardioides mesophilus TaxID=433659 RepID=A0A7G9RC91_9ACTN|nr:DUF1365 domain-containing protein [Nocardioides mesophilus]QNN53216.1 DUF1365 domain-containing protein [Nocardioides mesophilus]
MTAAPARVRARVWHRRTSPFTYTFEHGTTMWLVDAADPDAAFPRWLRPLASIRPVDHFAGDDDRPLLEKVHAFLRAQDLGWSAARVLVLANARSLGYVFDPLTTYFCLDADGRLEGVLAEVHNTYGERHCYPLAVAGGATAAVDKEFYVSPFFAVEGRYDIRTRLSESKVSVAISLTQRDRTVFTATIKGDLVPATSARTLGAVLRNPLPSHRVSALIRWHGIRLWLRRLPVVKRRPHQAPEGMASAR